MLLRSGLMMTPTRRRQQAQQGGVDLTTFFASGQKGALYDPFDTTTTFKDNAGLEPATLNGDPVERVNDLSGNGHTLQSGADANRPALTISGDIKSLLFDGVQDQLSAAISAGDLTATTTVILPLKTTDNQFSVIGDNDSSPAYIPVPALDGSAVSFGSFATNIEVNKVSQSWGTRDDAHTALATGEWLLFKFDTNASAFTTFTISGFLNNLLAGEVGTTLVRDNMTTQEISDASDEIIRRYGIS